MGPLRDVKILELANGIHGPYAAMLLGDMGADVIKVEPPQGDLNRGAAIVDGPITIGSQYYACNRNKRVMTVDLSTPQGQEIVRTLALRSDVLVENMRPGVLAKFGLGYEDLKDANPGLIYASATAYGMKGPNAGRAGLDIVAQAAGGIVAHTGTIGTGPLPVGTAIADHVGAVWLAYGVMLALYERSNTGKGQWVGSSLLGSQIGIQAWELSHFLLSGLEPAQGDAGHGLARGLWRVFRAADGWFAIAGVTEARWPRLCAAIGADELTHDARFRTAKLRLDNQDALIEEFSRRFAAIPLDTLLKAFEDADQVASRVMSYGDLATDETVRANGYIVDYDAPGSTKLPMVGIPVWMSETPGEIRSIPPDRDAHTAEILTEIGISTGQISELLSTGVVGAAIDR